MNIVENFNIDSWPIVYFKINNTELNDIIFEDYQKYYLSLLIKCKKNNEKMIFISDLKTLEGKNDFPMKYIFKQVEFNKKIYEFNKKFIKCFIVICNNRRIKTIINTFFMIIRPAAPFKLCRDQIKANKYLFEKFNINFDITIYSNDINEDNVNDEDPEEINMNELNELNIEEEDNKIVFTKYFNELKS